MFQATKMLFLYVETPLHAGTGRGLGTVDLPIQRERTTGYPMVYATGVKGSLRAVARQKGTPGALTDNELFAVFGPETTGADAYAGALSTGDARILLFPVRSLSGVFAWVTALMYSPALRAQQPRCKCPSHGQSRALLHPIRRS